MFSSTRFMVSDLTFKSVSILNFFLHGKRVNQFDSLACSCLVFPKPFFGKVDLSPHCIFSQINFPSKCRLTLGSLLCSVDLRVSVGANTMLF